MASLLAGGVRHVGRAAPALIARAPTGWARSQCRGRRWQQMLRAEQCSGGELPPELQGLSLTDDGLLVDERTGEVINEYGATRFDVKVRALRGEFDPSAQVANTERTPGLLLDSLMTFPGTYTFNVVLRPAAATVAATAAGPGAGESGDAGAGGSGSIDPQALLVEVAALVARVCETHVPLEGCSAKARMGGKYISLALPVVVRAPELVHRVFAELEKDPRVMMKY